MLRRQTHRHPPGTPRRPTSPRARSPWTAAWGIAVAVAATGCAPEPRPLSEGELEAIKSELREELLAELRDEATAPPSPIASTTRDAPPVIRPTTAPPTPAPDEPRARLTPDPIPGEPEPPEAAPTRLPPRHVEPVDDPPDAPTVDDASTPDPDGPDEPTEPDATDPRREMVRPGAYVYPGTETLGLGDLAVATSIVDRLPQDVRASYEGVPSLMFCYTQFDNRGPEVTVTHVWRRGTRLVSRVELQVGKSPTWRTWSRQRTRDDWRGPWSCEVLDPDGARIGLVEFELGSGAGR